MTRCVAPYSIPWPRACVCCRLSGRNHGLQYAKLLYGITPPGEDVGDVDDVEANDIEASIQSEIDGIKAAKPRAAGQAFTPIRPSTIDCVFFMKTRSPVEPTELVRRICKDARGVLDSKGRKARYLNRLTPVTFMGKATEAGVGMVARQTLAQWFNLVPEGRIGDAGHGNVEGKIVELNEPRPEKGPEYSVSIHLTRRPRNNPMLRHTLWAAMLIRYGR